jgi:hypothetical protein
VTSAGTAAGTEELRAKLDARQKKVVERDLAKVPQIREMEAVLAQADRVV